MGQLFSGETALTRRSAFSAGRQRLPSCTVNFVLIQSVYLRAFVVRAILATLSAARHGKVPEEFPVDQEH